MSSRLVERSEFDRLEARVPVNMPAGASRGLRCMSPSVTEVVAVASAQPASRLGASEDWSDWEMQRVKSGFAVTCGERPSSYSPGTPGRPGFGRRRLAVLTRTRRRDVIRGLELTAASEACRRLRGQLRQLHTIERARFRRFGTSSARAAWSRRVAACARATGC